MAFSDWLTSDGHFMLFYPWLSSAGDKFVEHGHRLLGALAGLLSIGLVLVVWRTEPRSWVRKFSLILLAGVVLQGILGGLRVVLDQRTLALVHGCTGPLFFALSVAMVLFTSRWWQTAARLSGKSGADGKKLFRLAVLCAGLAYAQLVIGAVVRHTPSMTAAASSAWFQVAVYFHLLLALLLVGHIGLLAWRSVRTKLHSTAAVGLVLLIGVQILLGAGTWLLKYGVPYWATSLLGELNFVIAEADLLQAAIITSHVAVGSLIFVMALAIAVQLGRQVGLRSQAELNSNSRLAGVAR